MQTSQEMIFHPAMGIGLTAGRIQAITDGARRRDTRRADTERRHRCEDRRMRVQDSVHIFQCA